MTGVPQAGDQYLGDGDGVRTRFDLVKFYGEQARRITRPVAASVRVTVDGVELTAGWSLGEGGAILFATPPAAGDQVRAGFLFDVPVRFAEDRLETALASPMAGEAASVPLVEVRE